MERETERERARERESRRENKEGGSYRERDGEDQNEHAEDLVDVLGVERLPRSNEKQRARDTARAHET